MTDARLTECGFQIAALPFPGPRGRMLYFASRVSDDRNVEYFTVDLCAGMLIRSTARGAPPGRWTLEEAYLEFDREPEPDADLTFLERCRRVGFIRTQPTGCPVGDLEPDLFVSGCGLQRGRNRQGVQAAAGRC